MKTQLKAIFGEVQEYSEGYVINIPLLAYEVIQNLSDIAKYGWEVEVDAECELLCVTVFKRF